MTESLAEARCEPCNAQSPPVSADERRELQRELPDWEIVEVEGAPRLQRSFRFADFAGALAFANRVGEAAEAEGHHPEITIGWGAATVAWWTHAIRDLHRNDFVMAAKTDRLASEG